MLGIVLGTGPSLALVADQVRDMRRRGVAWVFGVNNTFEDFELDAWIACDPAWHEHYGQVEGDFDKWHWDRGICERFGYRYIEGVWMVDGVAYPRSEHLTPPGLAGGLWLEDDTRISLNHCSSAQALNLAVHYGCDPIALVGHDFRYQEGQPRHYFRGLSDDDGEYPSEIRKHSPFDKQGRGDDLLAVYQRTAEQAGLPSIINCTPGSALPWFPFGELQDLEYKDDQDLRRQR